jgi:hypothetical protein
MTATYLRSDLSITLLHISAVKIQELFMEAEISEFGLSEKVIHK